MFVCGVFFSDSQLTTYPENIIFESQVKRHTIKYLKIQAQPPALISGVQEHDLTAHSRLRSRHMP